MSKKYKKTKPSGDPQLSLYQGGKGKVYTPCYESHKPMKIVVGNETYEIHGGSCTATPPEGMDVLIAFDRGFVLVPHAMPWLPGEFVFFPITDMSVPKSVTQFKKLIEWTEEQLIAGKKVHAGCIGGHGRTGTFLAALVKHMTGEEDAIAYVRKNYCKKAVESNGQVDWLNTHFGIKKVECSKPSYAAVGGGGYWGNEGYGGHEYGTGYGSTVTKASSGYKSTETIRPVKSKMSIHGSGDTANKIVI